MALMLQKFIVEQNFYYQVLHKVVWVSSFQCVNRNEKFALVIMETLQKLRSFSRISNYWPKKLGSLIWQIDGWR